MPRRRDRHELQERPEADLRVRQWAGALEAGYRLVAQRLGQVPGLTGAHRQACYRRVGTRVAERGRQDAQVRTHPWQALATRRRQQDARCQVVLVDGRPAHTNATERRRRPVVVVRKRSGGTQRSAGRKTRLGVASRFAPWQARGLTPFTDCLHRLRQPPFPPICTLTPCSLFDKSCAAWYYMPCRRGVEQWQLVGLITRRSVVRIHPPLPTRRHNVSNVVPFLCLRLLAMCL